MIRSVKMVIVNLGKEKKTVDKTFCLKKNEIDSKQKGSLFILFKPYLVHDDKEEESEFFLIIF